MHLVRAFSFFRDGLEEVVPISFFGLWGFSLRHLCWSYLDLGLEVEVHREDLRVCFPVKTL